MALAALTLAVLAPSAAIARNPPAPGADVQAVVSGTLTICVASGTRPVTGAFPFTLAAPGSAGGTQTLSVSVGTCSAQVFYPQGTQVIVTEILPAGDTVESFSIGGSGGTIVSSNPAAANATIAVGSGQASLTVKTSGPTHDCVVPYLAGLSSAAASAALRKSSCTMHVARKLYSSSVAVGRVISQSPRRGTVLAANAPVDVIISRGRRP
jgi:hypothetical protein